MHKSSSSINLKPLIDTSMQEYPHDFNRHPVFVVDKTTTDIEGYIENYGNPLCEVSKSYFMVVIEKKEDKVSLKIFDGFRYRQVGKPWFKISKNVNYITVNTKTGDVYVGSITGYNKKKKCVKRMRRNLFMSEPIKTFRLIIKSHLSSYDVKGYDIATEVINEFMSQIEIPNSFNNLTNCDKLFKFYLDKRGIKYPNNFPVYCPELYGPEIRKILKKNGNKLVEAFMTKNNISGKKLKKALHNCSNINIELYKTAREIFGDDWLNQEDGVILDLLNSIASINRIDSRLKELSTEEELKRVYSIFKQVYIYQTLDGYTFYDHVRMYIELKLFGEQDLKWYGVDNTSFREEHLDWSDKLQHYKKGYYNRIYPEFMYDKISEPIDGFYPVILDNSDVYNNESSIQSNCVKGYIGKPPSFVVSVREGSSESENRATIEYYFNYNLLDKKVEVNRIQSLGKFNNRLTSEWDNVLFKLDEKMLSCVKDKRFETVKLTKKCNNGVMMESDTYWDETGRLRWVHKNIESNYSIFINNIEFNG